MAAVLLKTCDNSFQAKVLKGALEAEGIECILQGENFSVIYGGAFGVNVLVDEADLEEANRIIEEAE